MLDVMISSTVNDMLSDRAAAISALKTIPFVRPIGVKPVNQPPVAASPYVTTIQMAEECHLYVLMLGRRYGDAQSGSESPTELEFDAAYQVDPTKILVFKKQVTRREARQTQFIRRVGTYYSGFWITSYSHEDDLSSLLVQAFEYWIRERAAIGSKLNYFDHFVRMSIQRTPAPGAQLSYSVKERHIELEYNLFGDIRTIHIEKSKVLQDFWGTIAILDRTFAGWRRGSNGKPL